MHIHKKNYPEAVADFFALISSHMLGTVFSIAISVATMRFLRPCDYGLFASSLFLFSLFGWLFDWGLEQALLATSPQDFAKACSAHLALRVAASLFACILVAGGILTGCATDCMQMQVLAILCAAFGCEKVGLSYKTMLEKTGQLKKLARLEFTAGLVGAISALLFAMRGHGAASLAGQYFLQRALQLLGYLVQCRQVVVPQFDLKIYASFFKSFGLPSFLSATFGLVIYDFMPFLIARIAGVQEAGLYARAFSIATMPLIGSAVFGRIFNTACAQNIFDAAALARWFAVLQISKACLILPAQLLLIYTSAWWSNILFAQKWAGLVPVYVVLAFYGLARAFYDDVTAVISVGFKNPWVFTFTQACHALLVLLLAPGLIFQFKALGAALLMAASMSLITGIFWQKIFNFLGLEFRSFLLLGRQTLYAAGIDFVRTRL
jgi:O-antigen/teichoic acid export membrane protein